ncbi:hypothetical protein IQ266_26430 [filamentous cyanobacterium LEGE 11480]|uniref:Uncharacterized protein n=1 Tax=Romeriopsis navalis LEGE 11480 TaxID=2777977 RepID=A0A928VRF6_9CYAN|nr:hypothetical protein [Romeriopsis navalis]MBE9033276.1 hypothetical protein [Romeriopsis navalis LEGE 11480]
MMHLLEIPCDAMTTETNQLLVFLQTVSQTRGLTHQHKSTLLKILRQSSDEVVREAWAGLPPWQCERLWAIARSAR